jgi:hypothetical protein
MDWWVWIIVIWVPVLAIMFVCSVFCFFPIIIVLFVYREDIHLHFELFFSGVFPIVEKLRLLIILYQNGVWPLLIVPVLEEKWSHRVILFERNIWSCSIEKIFRGASFFAHVLRMFCWNKVEERCWVLYDMCAVLVYRLLSWIFLVTLMKRL